MLWCFLLIHFFNSCQQSRKGEWSTKDKEKVRKELQKADDFLGYLGRKKVLFISFYLEKLEAHYSNLEEANQDETGCTKLADGCLKALHELK
jgi:hypothetical protein